MPRRSDLSIAVAAWALAAVLALVPPWRIVELRAFDWLSALNPPGPPTSDIVVIGIDEASFAELALQWPWPREVHARLIERLRGAGAAVIAFDVLFSEPSRPESDARLADAIRQAGNVVLAADESLVETGRVVQRMRIEPLPELVAAGGRTGLVTLPLDPDGVIRRLSPGPDTFGRAILDVYERSRREAKTAVAVPPGSFIRYTGPFESVSYYQALEPEKFLPRGVFRGRIVLIGLVVQASPEPRARPTDAFATPLLVRTGRFIPGVEVQASALDTVMHARFVREVPRWGQALALGLVGLVSTTAFAAWRPVRSTLSAFGIATAIVALTVVLFRLAGVWLPSVLLVLGVALHHLGQGALAFAREHALRRRIKQAFAHYVSPELVERIIAEPGRLRLGGERRELTILFSDLAGFTSIAERLSPEEVVQLLNRHLTEITRAVVGHGGTVVKFLGDGLMAFWGAPVDDPEHAIHACQSAHAMQAAVARLRDELTASGSPPLYMRIGIHTGAVVVGNMGSDTRFDYTATGDAVNLASRLESANKVYGTRILVSEDTVRLAAKGIGFRRVDRVRVKGKSLPTELFTLEGDAEVVRLTDEAMEAYRKRRVDDAEALWRRLLVQRPDDPLAATYLERIAALRAAPPTGDWDPTVTLTEK